MIRPPYVCRPRRNYFLSLLECNLIAFPAAAMFSREALLAIGGTDPEVDGSEDYDLYLRLAHKYDVMRHTGIVAENRTHGSNLTRYSPRLIRCANRTLDKVERTINLTAKERPRLDIGRARAAVYFGDQKGLWPKRNRYYFRLR